MTKPVVRTPGEIMAADLAAVEHRIEDLTRKMATSQTGLPRYTDLQARRAELLIVRRALINRMDAS